MPHTPPPTERQKLGNYLGQGSLEQMLLGLQASYGPQTAQLVDHAGELLGRRTAQDWQLGHGASVTTQLPLLLEAALGPEGHGLCRVRQAYHDGAGWQVKARLPKYDLMRTFTGAALRGLLSELLGQRLALCDIRPDGLLLSHLSFIEVAAVEFTQVAVNKGTLDTETLEAAQAS